MDTRGPITPKDIVYLSERVGGQRTQKILESLAKSQQFLNALETPVGRELLREVDNEIERLARLVVMDDTAKPEDKMLLRAYISIGNTWAERIKKYHDKVREVRGPEPPEAA